MENEYVIYSRLTPTAELDSDDILTRINDNLDSLSSLRNRALMDENGTNNVTSIIEREDFMLQQLIDLFHVNVMHVRDDLQRKLIEACERSAEASATYAELNDDYQKKLWERRKIIMSEWRANYVKTFQSDRINFLKNFVSQVHSQINDRMIAKKEEFESLMTEKRIINEEIVKLETRRLQISRKQKKLRAKLFADCEQSASKL